LVVPLAHPVMAVTNDKQLELKPWFWKWKWKSKTKQIL
jgi:hypothetical protein